MTLDRLACRRACDARDPRFDGLFFVAIVTTRIYCRPICPTRRVPIHRCRFFPTAAAAEQEGFRPCLRCRPELAPGRASVDAVPRLAQLAAARIAGGALNGRSVDQLAAEFGVGARQLRRAVQHELGVSPVALAQTHRLLLAKQLLTETGMTVARIAFASGFQSLRRFNALFREQYRINPLALRRRPRVPRAERDDSDDDLVLTLGYRPPLAWPELLQALQRQAIPGVEWVDHLGYRRTVRIGDHRGVIAVSAQPASGISAAGRPLLRVRISSSLLPHLMALLPRVRSLLDLDAEPALIDAHLTANGLARLVRRHRGVRVPGAFDGFEAALRELVAASGEGVPATVILSRIAEEFGDPVPGSEPTLRRFFPEAARLAWLDPARLATLGVPARLCTSIEALASAVAGDRIRVGPSTDPDAAIDRFLAEVPVSRLTAERMLWEAVSWPDRRWPDSASTERDGSGVSPALFESWRPWRAYATVHLWLAAESPRRRLAIRVLPASRPVAQRRATLLASGG